MKSNLVFPLVSPYLPSPIGYPITGGANGLPPSSGGGGAVELAASLAGWIFYDSDQNPAVYSNNTTLLDQVPNRTNRARLPGRVLTLNGTNQYASLVQPVNVIAHSGTYSTVLYFKTEDAADTSLPLWESSGSTSNRNGSKFHGPSGYCAFGFYNGSAYTGIRNTNGGNADGRWHCLVCTCNAGTLKIYVDGNDYSEAIAMGNLNSTATITIGYLANGAFYADASFAHYFEFTRVLTQAEAVAFTDQMLRPWQYTNWPTDFTLYNPLADGNGSTIQGGPNSARAAMINYAAGMNPDDGSAPFVIENLAGYSTAYHYNGSNNYHTAVFNPSTDLPAAGTIEIAMIFDTVPAATAMRHGCMAAASQRLTFGASSSGASSRLGIGFGSINEGSTGATGGSTTHTVVANVVYGLKVEYDATNATLSWRRNGGAWTEYKTAIAHGGSFYNGSFLIGANNLNGTPSHFFDGQVLAFNVWDSNGAVVFSTGVDGWGAATASPTAIKRIGLPGETTDPEGIALETSGLAKLNCTITGYSDGDPILQSGDSFAITETDDPCLQGQVLPVSYAHNDSLTGKSLVLGRDDGTLETRFYLAKPRYQRLLACGNSLTNLGGVEQWMPAPGVYWKSVHSNTSLGSLAADPTLNLSGGSYQWDLCLADAGTKIDTLVIQPFTADTPYTNIDGSSPTLGSELTGARTIIDAVGSTLKKVVVFTGYNRQADHATDYVRTHSGNVGDGMIYCPTFFAAFMAALEADYPSLEIVLCDVLGMYEAIYQDIVGATSYYAAWANLYSDGTHPAGNLNRLSAIAVRRAIKPLSACNPASYRGFPWAAANVLEMNYQDLILNEVLP